MNRLETERYNKNLNKIEIHKKNFFFLTYSSKTKTIMIASQEQIVFLFFLCIQHEIKIKLFLLPP